MRTFADRLIAEIQRKGNPCVVGLDPQLEMMPDFVTSRCVRMPLSKGVRFAITLFHETVLDVVAARVPAVKLQIAFYEQYGLPGLLAFADTIKAAKKRGLLVLVDAKRNDISSTAGAYANAYLGTTWMFGQKRPIYDVDCITVSPYLGGDSIEPFVQACKDYGKGIFVLVKTSNRGSADFQDRMCICKSQRDLLYTLVAQLVNRYAMDSVGENGYSSIGAVVGATFPKEAELLRKMLPHSIFLVPGYGAQGGSAKDAACCFDKEGLGAVVNASRSITYGAEVLRLNKGRFVKLVEERTVRMIKDINGAVRDRTARGLDG